MEENKTHFRKAFDSPYLSSADIVGPTTLTIKYVRLEKDLTKKTQDYFNTAYFLEPEIRSGEKLKPMILNASNSKTLRAMNGSSFIDDWNNMPVTIYVDPNVRFGREVVEGLRISPDKPEAKFITPDKPNQWKNAKAAFLRDGNLKAVLAKYSMTQEHQELLIKEASEGQ